MPALSARRRLFGVLGALYLAQAIPSYLFAAALPPILRDVGVSRAALGLLGLLMLPLVLKIAWAPLVDRTRPLAYGHRRAWILLTQSGMALTILSLALIGPQDFVALLALGMLLALLAATQDIATDGYATARLSAQDRPIGNAIQGGSIALGVVVGGTLSLLLYDRIGWSATMLVLGAISALPLLALPFMDDDAPLPPRGQRRRPSLAAFLQRPEAVRVLLVALTYRASEGLVKAMEGPYLVDAGVELDTIGWLSGGAAPAATVAGSAAAALLVRRTGARASLVLLGVLRTLCFLVFALHALDLFGGISPVLGATALQTLIRYMEIVALYSLFMAAAASDQPGTDFTLLACAQLLVYLLGSVAAGLIAEAFGYGSLFLLAALLSGAAVVLTAAILRRERLAPA